ncbi:hypothetical protein M9Y10_012909 [Tritrichomonas musculus]|uniref:Uncharacterized protein n=1 Tax=Tritrichomonas musculus TaxID=1915356 RepID=A0ABR2I7C1_9EUKA
MLGIFQDFHSSMRNVEEYYLRNLEDQHQPYVPTIMESMSRVHASKQDARVSVLRHLENS